MQTVSRNITAPAIPVNKKTKLVLVLSFIKHRSIIIYALLFILAFLLGVTNTSIKSRNIALENISFSDRSFYRILLNNSLLGLSLLVGFLFFNIYNGIAVFLNGLMWGFYVNKFFGNLGVINTLFLFLPHSIIEFYWIISISAYSTYLSFYFCKFINSGFKDVRLFRYLFCRKTLIFFVIILLGAFLENYITGLIFNFFNSRAI